jgi:hypothetical protein
LFQYNGFLKLVKAKITYSMYAAQSMCHPSALWSVAINTVLC